MLRHWRLLILLITIIGAIFAIGLKAHPHGREGVEIVFVSENSPADNVLEQGMVITHINGQKIKNIDEWNAGIRAISGEFTLTVNGKDYSFDLNETLGIDVLPIERTNLEFGLDLRGGTRIILKPIENISHQTLAEIMSTLQTRANLYGLQEMQFQTIETADGFFIQIDATGVGGDIVENLLSQQGNFKAKILKPVDLINNQGSLILGQDTFDVSLLDNDTVSIQNIIVSLNESFTLNDIEFEYVDIIDNRLIFHALVYEGDDIELVYTDPQRAGIVPRGNFYNFFFSVLISQEGSQRFADVTTGIPTFIDIQTGEEYLDSMIYLFLDDQLVSELQISAGLGGRVVDTPQITGSRETQEEASAESLRLQTILRSGALPTGLETLSVIVIAPTLGTEFFNAAGVAVLLAAIAVFIITFIRYRSLKISLPLIFVGFSEILIILGIAATNDSLIWGFVLILNFLIISLAWWKKEEIDIFAWAGAILIPILGMVSFTIDLPVIGGIIAALGTSVDHQIIIADETLAKEEKKEYSLRQKIKRAFFIIFGAAATTIAAMLPLMFIGVGLIRGFAITTIIGILVGILITRPAYAKIIEILIGRRKQE